MVLDVRKRQHVDDVGLRGAQASDVLALTCKRSIRQCSGRGIRPSGCGKDAGQSMSRRNQLRERIGCMDLNELLDVSAHRCQPTK